MSSSSCEANHREAAGGGDSSPSPFCVQDWVWLPHCADLGSLWVQGSANRWHLYMTRNVAWRGGVENDY